MKSLFFIPAFLFSCIETDKIYFLVDKKTGLKETVTACYGDIDKVKVLIKKHSILSSYKVLEKISLDPELYRCEVYTTGEPFR